MERQFFGGTMMYGGYPSYGMLHGGYPSYHHHHHYSLGGYPFHHHHHHFWGYPYHHQPWFGYRNEY